MNRRTPTAEPSRRPGRHAPVAADQEPVLVAAFKPIDLYERALLVAANHPKIFIHPKIAEVLPTYRDQREAASAMLARQPAARMAARPDSPVRSSWQPIPPPDELVTAALADRIAGAVKRLGEVHPRPVDTARHRAALRKAYWSGSQQDIVSVWAAWMSDLASNRNAEVELDELETFLCMTVREPSAHRGPLGPGSEPTAADAQSWPWLSVELDRAARCVPPRPAARKDAEP